MVEEGARGMVAKVGKGGWLRSREGWMVEETNNRLCVMDWS